MKISVADHTALPILRHLATAANDVPYDLGGVIEEKCFGAGPAGAPVTRIAFEGDSPAGFSVSSGRYLRLLAVDRAFRHRGVGRALLDRVETDARERGENRVVVGGEPGNYFVPGVFQNDGETRAFFARHRYDVSGQEIFNMRVSLNGNAFLGGPDNAQIRRARTGDRAAVGRFVGRIFGPMWGFEIDRVFSCDPITLLLFFTDDEIAGFSAHDVNNRGLGTFGPAGVDPERRGGGIGGDLLLASLRDLAHMGYSESIIPWVSSVKFYESRCGAHVSETFIGYRRTL